METGLVFPRLSAVFTVSLLTIGASSALAERTPVELSGGDIRVEVWQDDGWREAGRLPFGLRTGTRSLTLPDGARVRLSAPGVYGAYLDSVSLDGALPSSAEPDGGGALRKLARADSDILEIPAARFTATSRAPWEHKVYEFAMPLSEIGAPKEGEPIRLAFAAYGTASAGAAIDLFSEAAHLTIGVPGAPPACSQGGTVLPPPLSIIGSQRDLAVSAPLLSPGPVVASVGPPMLTFNGTLGTGNAVVTWDGVDDCLAVGTATPLGNFGALASEVTVSAVNAGTSPVSVVIRFHGPTGYLEAPAQVLFPLEVLSAPIPFSAFTPVGSADFSDVRAVVLEVDNSAYTPGANLQVSSVVLTGPPLPVTLTLFWAE